jgi:hypothetical protein
MFAGKRLAHRFSPKALKSTNFFDLIAKLDLAGSVNRAQCTAHEPFLNFL